MRELVNLFSSSSTLLLKHGERIDSFLSLALVYLDILILASLLDSHVAFQEDLLCICCFLGVLKEVDVPLDLFNVLMLLLDLLFTSLLKLLQRLLLLLYQMDSE
jgi:hypothetical protein